jgi:hypothetical protein
MFRTRVLPGKLSVPQDLKKFLAFCENPKFISVFTKSGNWALA